MEDLLKVGVITTTHGVRGEVKVFPTTDPERFLDLEYVILDAGRKMKKLEIRNVKFFKNLVILKFFANVFFDQFRIFPEKTHIQHCFLILSCQSRSSSSCNSRSANPFKSSLP